MIDTDFERAIDECVAVPEVDKVKIPADWLGDNAMSVDIYLDDLIAKASPQWKGVDADAFMDIVRGREPETITEHLASVSEDWNFIINEPDK